MRKLLLGAAIIAGLLAACRHAAPNGTHTCTYMPVGDGGVVFSVDCNK